MNHKQMLGLLEKLINIPSVTPFDHGCQTIIKQQLEHQGFKTKILNSEPVHNLWAEIGNNDGPLFVFAGHTDVVPEGELGDWLQPPYQAKIDNNKIYGRGACDMKGALCAMLYASANFLKESPNFKGRLGYLITSGEEGDDFMQGTLHVMQYLEQNNIKIDYCLIGEPSSTKTVGDVIKVGRRGSLTADVNIIGCQGHVAYPHLAVNPIHQTSQLLADLSTISFDNGNDYFQPTTFQVTNINSGTGAGNVIPSTLSFKCNFRYSTEITHIELKEIVENLIFEKYNLKAEIKWLLNGKPFLTKQGALVNAAKQAIKQHTDLNSKLSTTGGTSDGRFIAPYNVQVIELGVINDCIHKVNEYTSISELKTLSEIYQTICQKLLIK